MAAQPSGVSTPPPSLVSSANLLRVHSNSSSRSLMKKLNKTGPSTDPWGTPLVTRHTGRIVLPARGPCPVFIASAINSYPDQEDCSIRRVGSHLQEKFPGTSVSLPDCLTDTIHRHTGPSCLHDDWDSQKTEEPGKASRPVPRLVHPHTHNPDQHAGGLSTVMVPSHEVTFVTKPM